MKLYDTLSGEKKELIQPKGRKLNMFVCGPTVYDYPHIGNARTFVMFDMIVKYLRSRGFDIFYLQNITNVDDKIIQRAIDEKTTWDKVADKFEQAFYDCNKRLGITSVSKFAKSTEFIHEVIGQVKVLKDKGHAYKIDNDGWYFDLKTFPEYGKLSRRTMDQAQTSVEQGTSRIDNSDKKRNAGDFCLWKFSKPGEPVWESELGAGRPGWHIEDTATTEHFFGPQYDIHGGALDLKFPHHEAELTQQEAASGKSPFVNFWMHAGFLTVNGQKMSKSLGNFTTVDDLLKKMSADEFRMMLLMSHYRSPLDYTDQLVKMAKDAVHYFRVRMQNSPFPKGSTAEGGEGFQKEFEEAMDDDLNTPKALAALRQSTNVEFIKKSLASLGINIAASALPSKVQELFEKYKLSRSSKQFANSDALRKDIEGLGYIIEDTKEGSLILPKS